MYLLLCISQLGFLEVLDNQSTPNSSASEWYSQISANLASFPKYFTYFWAFLDSWEALKCC